MKKLLMGFIFLSFISIANAGQIWDDQEFLGKTTFQKQMNVNANFISTATITGLTLNASSSTITNTLTAGTLTDGIANITGGAITTSSATIDYAQIAIIDAISGDIATNSTFDGRDIASDGLILDEVYTKRVDTWGDGLDYSTTTKNASVDYNTGNLQITFNQLDTIQDISTISSPTFASVMITNDVDVGGNIYSTGSVTASEVFASTVTAYLSGTATNTEQIDGYSLNISTEISTGQFLKYNGVEWINVDNGIIGAGKAVSFFLDDTLSAGTTFYSLLDYPNIGVEGEDSVVVNSSEGDKFIEAYISTTTGLGGTIIEGGAWTFFFYGYVDNATGDSRLVFDIYSRTITGDETFLFQAVSPEVNTTSIDELRFNIVQSSFSIASTDALLLKIYGRTTSVNDRTIYYTHNGTEHYSYIRTPLQTRHNELAGLQGGATDAYYHSDQPINIISNPTFEGLNLITGISASTASITTNITTPQIIALDSAGLQLYEDGGNGIFIEDGGNVGIGTDTPVAKLDVIGDIFSRQIKFTDAQFADEMWNGISQYWTTDVTTGGRTIQARTNGWYRLTTGASATNEESIDWNDITNCINTQRPTFEVRLNVEEISNTEIEVGLKESKSIGIDDYIMMSFDPSAQNTWFLQASNAGASTTDQGAIATTDEILLRFEFTSDTALEWFINNVSQGVIATNIPAVALQPFLKIRTEEDVAHYVDFDFVKIWQKRS